MRASGGGCQVSEGLSDSVTRHPSPDTVIVQGNTLVFRAKTCRCAVGKGGFSANKKEGDGCTPLGVYRLRECWYRADRTPKPETGLPLRIIHKNDGWCDDPKSPVYNRHVTLPPAGGVSAERLWHDDHVYDLIVPIGYNDAPAVPGRGSAIFLHVATPDYAPTEGCVALAENDLLALLVHVHTGSSIEIRETA
ncbi:MAG: L,D-transpeptidase family protein [Pseudomonadota bacterium]|nr:L,D-transpeptidase family protein [Pseudomonadota bacterium]